MQVNTADAKNKLSELIHLLQTGQEEEILIANRGKAVVKMVLFRQEPKRRLGMARGKWAVPDDIDDCNEEVAGLFGVLP